MSKIRLRLAAIGLICASTPALADWELGGGSSDEIFGELSPTVHLSYRAGTSDRHVFTVGAVGERQTSRRDISPTTAYLSYVYRIPIRRFYFGIGLALASDTSEVISSHLSFNETLGWRFSERWQLELRHISNNGREGRNIGENLLTLIHRFD